jgi:protein ImuB
MGRVLSIYLPTWDVDLARRNTQDGATPLKAARQSALLLVIMQARQQVVARCCLVAQASGVVRGMSLAEARMLCDAVIEQPFDGAKSRAALERMAHWCARFSPVVSLDTTPLDGFPEDTPDGFLLDITGEAHLFGSEELLLKEIAGWFKRLGLNARLAAAPTVGAAWALARFGPHRLTVVQEEQLAEALGPLPLAALRIDAETLENLQQVGVDRIDQLLKLPRESLRIRFGSDLLWRLDQAFGRIDERIVPLKPLEPLCVRRVFDGATTQLEAVTLTVQELIGEFAQRLLLKESGARKIRLELTRADAPPIACEITLGRPSRNEKHLWALLRPKVETMNMGHGVEVVTLTAAWVEPIRHTQHDAWDAGAQDKRQMEELLDTLTNRLRREQVLRVHAHESHMPENARTFEPVQEEPTKCDAVLVLADRPSLLLDPPDPANAMALLPDHPPARLQWQGAEHRLKTGIGPERIITEWWQDGGFSTRDYFKVQTEGGQWLWVYRELESSRWFVHGLW